MMCKFELKCHSFLCLEQDFFLIIASNEQLSSLYIPWIFSSFFFATEGHNLELFI